MLAEYESGARAGVLTADDDPHVTAARRLAPVEAQYAPFQTPSTRDCWRHYAPEASTSSTSHQAESIATPWPAATSSS
jgi:hypothetical protein